MAQQVVVITSAEDGYIDNNPLATFKTQNDIIVKAYDSTATLLSVGYWFFNTDDSVTGIPPSARITRIEFGYWVSASTLSAASTNEFFYSSIGIFGSTLEDADFQGSAPIDGEVHDHPDANPVIGQNIEVLHAGTLVQGNLILKINRSGYTNVRMTVTENNPPTQLTIDAVEKPGGHPAFLRITYETVSLGGYTSYDLNRALIGSPEASSLPEVAAAAWRGDQRGMR